MNPGLYAGTYFIQKIATSFCGKVGAEGETIKSIICFTLPYSENNDAPVRTFTSGRGSSSDPCLR